MSRYTVFSLCQSALLWAPLAAMPLILNLRWLVLDEPNEAPKWAVFTLAGLVIALAGAMQAFAFCRQPSQSSHTKLEAYGPAGGLWLFVMGVGLGVTYAANPGTAMTRWAYWCDAALVSYAVAYAVGRYPVPFLSNLRWTSALSAVGLCLTFWYGFFNDFDKPGFNDAVLFSRIGHYNYTADTLVTLIPLLGWIFLAGQGYTMKFLAGFAGVSCVFMLVTSGSLGGMGGLVGGGLVAALIGAAGRIIQPRLRKAANRKHPLLRLGYVLLTLTALCVGGKELYPQIPKTYRDQLFTRAEWWSAPKANATNAAKLLPPLTPLWVAITPYLGARTPMWASTTGMVAEHPWRGFGTGSYLFEYPAFEKRYDLFKDPETLGNQIRTDPHNVLLWIAAENGLPIMFLFAGLYAWLMIKVTVQAWRSPDVFWLCGVWALWAAGLDAQVNQVFFSPASLFMIAVGIGLWYGALPVTVRTAIRIPIPCRIWGNTLSPVLCSVAALWIASYPLTWLVSEYHVSEARRLEASRTTTSYRQILLSWVNARRWFPSNPNALYGLANAAFGQGHFSSAEGYLNAFLNLAPYHTPGLNLLANLQMKENRYDEAERTLERALQIEPDAQALRDNLDTLRKNRMKPQAPTTTTDAPSPTPQGRPDASQ